MPSITKIIIGLVGVVVLLGAVYFLFFNNSSSSAVTTSAAPASAAEVVFLNLASKINPVVFDTSIFSDPRFAALVDIHTAILPEVAGRKDPFASIPGVTSAAATGGK